MSYTNEHFTIYQARLVSRHIHGTPITTSGAPCVGLWGAISQGKIWLGKSKKERMWRIYLYIRISVVGCQCNGWLDGASPAKKEHTLRAPDRYITFSREGERGEMERLSTRQAGRVGGGGGGGRPIGWEAIRVSPSRLCQRRHSVSENNFPVAVSRGRANIRVCE